MIDTYWYLVSPNQDLLKFSNEQSLKSYARQKGWKIRRSNTIQQTFHVVTNQIPHFEPRGVYP